MRARGRPPGLFERLWSVARYELTWDLRKYWVIGAIVLLVLMTVAGVVVANFLRPSSSGASGPQVTFAEVGLPPGTPWTVTVGTEGAPDYLVLSSTSTAANGWLAAGTQGSVGFQAGEAVSHVTTYRAVPTSWNFTVSGSSPVRISVPFTPAGGGSGPVDLDAAADLAAQAVSVLGGNWSLTLNGVSAGTDDTSAYTNTSQASNGVCGLTGGTGTWPTSPVWTGNYSDGRLSTWQFEFLDLYTDSEAFVTVQGARATLIGYVTGASCVPSLAPTEAGPGSILNSTVAATSLLSADHAYVLAHPRASSLFELIGLGPRGTGGPDWLVNFSTCSPSGGGGSGSSFVAYVSATNGGLVQSTNLTVNCPPASTYARTFPSSPSLSGSGPSSPTIPDPIGPFLWTDLLLAAGGFGFLPVLMWIGSASSSESFAREKDLGTLPALLQQPLRRSEVVLGKWLAKSVLFLLVSAGIVGLVVALALVVAGPQQGLVYLPLIVLELALTFLSFSALAMLFSTLVRRSKSAAHLVTLVVVLMVLVVGRVGSPWIFFLPGLGVWTVLPGTRMLVVDPTGSAFVTALPQAVAASLEASPYTAALAPLFVWGQARVPSFAALSLVGLVVDTVVFLALGMYLLRRYEAGGV